MESFAAAVVGANGELAGGDQAGEYMPHSPVAEAGVALQGGLVDDPLALVVRAVGRRRGG